MLSYTLTMDDLAHKPDAPTCEGDLTLLTEAEMACSDFFTYMPDRMGSTQLALQLPGHDPATIHGVTLFFMRGHGYAVVADYQHQRLFWYRFGCDHQWRELAPAECRTRELTHHGHCYHVYECARCHGIKAHDSSD
jgi:hypothetical protein